MDIWFNNVDFFEIKEFYTYPTTVVHRIVEWDEGFHINRPGNDEDIKELFNALLEETEKLLNKKDLMNNKIAMKVVYKPTGHVFYVGYKDWNWCLGLALNTYVTGEKIVVNEK